MLLVDERENTCLVTDWIRGISPGSKKAYTAPLNVVPISRAIMSFRSGPEYRSRAMSMEEEDSGRAVKLFTDLNIARGPATLSTSRVEVKGG